MNETPCVYLTVANHRAEISDMVLQRLAGMANVRAVAAEGSRLAAIVESLAPVSPVTFGDLLASDAPSATHLALVLKAWDVPITNTLVLHCEASA